MTLLALLLQIDWRTDHAEALQEARAAGRNVLLHLSTTW
jgi:hypothetical protein